MSQLCKTSQRSHSHFCEEVDNLIRWCRDNYLELNVKKTKELVIDFRRNPETIPELVINGKKVARVLEYKCLSTIIDHKLTLGTNAKIIPRKCQSKIYFSQKLRSLTVNQLVLGNFYRCFIQFVLTFGFLNWFGGLSLKNRNVLMTIVNVCGRIVGAQQTDMSALYERRVTQKAKVIAKDPGHTLAVQYQLLPSGRRFWMPLVATAGTRRSFV